MELRELRLALHEAVDRLVDEFAGAPGKHLGLREGTHGSCAGRPALSRAFQPPSRLGSYPGFCERGAAPPRCKGSQGRFEQLGVVSNLEALLAGLQGLANQPNDAAPQQQISAARTALQQLAVAPSNGWPSSDRQIAEELGLTDLIGEQLLQRIEGVLARNEITPTVAVTEITPIIEQVRNETPS